MVLDIQSPSREELVARASELVPLIRERSQWIDENRRLPADVIEGIERSGLLKMRVPARYGGYQSDARTLIDVHAEIARGDSSTAFCVSVWSLINWIAGLYPDEVQDEVFATPNSRVCGTLAATGKAAPKNGGYVLNGEWRFNSGVLHSHWKLVVAEPDEAGAAEGPIMAILPASSFEVVDDWHTHGLRGSGSVSVRAHDVYVPKERVRPVMEFFDEQCKSETNSAEPIYQVPMLVTSTVATAGQCVGAAEAAIEHFLNRLPGRKITYTDYETQQTAPLTHLQVGEATLLAEEARLRARTFADLVDAKAARNEPWTQAERIRSRVEMGRVAQLAQQSIRIISTASGGSSIYNDVPIQRIHRDIETIALHALTSPNTNIELLGRHLCGLEPNTTYL